MIPAIPASWHAQLRNQIDRPYFRELDAFLDADAVRHTILPPRTEILHALELTPYRGVKVLILGQDPYPTPGDAHGLAFSVRPGVKTPASLRNIFKELASDLGCRIPNNGSLVPWAQQGVLLLNAVLTVRAGEANAHRGKGWETFTDEIIRRVNGKKKSIVFVLWGAPAQQKRPLIDVQRHVVVTAPHPSPLSAKRGFFGSRPFSKINAALERAGSSPIDWQLPDL